MTTEQEEKAKEILWKHLKQEYKDMLLGLVSTDRPLTEYAKLVLATKENNSTYDGPKLIILITGEKGKQIYENRSEDNNPH